MDKKVNVTQNRPTSNSILQRGFILCCLTALYFNSFRRPNRKHCGSLITGYLATKMREPYYAKDPKLFEPTRPSRKNSY